MHCVWPPTCHCQLARYYKFEICCRRYVSVYPSCWCYFDQGVRDYYFFSISNFGFDIFTSPLYIIISPLKMWTILAKLSTLSEHVQIFEKYYLQFLDNIVHIWVMYGIDGVKKYLSLQFLVGNWLRCVFISCIHLFSLDWNYRLKKSYVSLSVLLYAPSIVVSHMFLCFFFFSL